MPGLCVHSYVSMFTMRCSNIMLYINQALLIIIIISSCDVYTCTVIIDVHVHCNVIIDIHVHCTGLNYRHTCTCTLYWT